MPKNSNGHAPKGHGASFTHVLPEKTKGSLIAIGGREEKRGARPILEEVARRAGSGKLVVCTLASQEPEEQWKEYQQVFRDLGVAHPIQLYASTREEMLDPKKLDIIRNAKVFFMAGGDQQKLASKLGGTPLCDALRDLFENGATIAGTSSGASILSETMLVAGETDESHRIGGSLRMGPGLGFISEVIIDQHFAERGRISRLVGAIARNPRFLGLGIDEDTAVVVERNNTLRVLGSGAVYIVDGREMTFSNAGSDDSEILSAFNVRLHVLSGQDEFDFDTRTPKYVAPDSHAVEKS